MKLYKETKTGLYCREGTCDEYVVKEQSCYRPLFELCLDKTVMDIGGNIGAFAYNAISYGANKVVSFEPEPDNIRLYKKQNLPSKLIEKAVSDTDGYSSLFINPAKNKGLHSLQNVSGRDTIQVRTCDFTRVINK